MAGKSCFLSTLALVLALTCVATAFKAANDDFVIAQGDANVPINCADPASLAVKYWNICGLRIQLSSCPISSITKRFATKDDDEKYYRAIDAKKHHDIKFDGKGYIAMDTLS